MHHLTQEIRSQNLSLAAPHSFIPSFVHSFIHVLMQLYIYSVCPRVIFKVETPEVSNWLDIGRDKREAFTNLVLIKTLPSKFLLPGIQTTSFVPLLPLTPLNKMYLRNGVPLSWASYPLSSLLTALSLTLPGEGCSHCGKFDLEVQLEAKPT